MKNRYYKWAGILTLLACFVGFALADPDDSNELKDMRCGDAQGGANFMCDGIKCFNQVVDGQDVSWNSTAKTAFYGCEKGGKEDCKDDKTMLVTCIGNLYKGKDCQGEPVSKSVPTYPNTCK